MKKTFISAIILLVLISSFSLVSALSPDTYQKMDLWSKLKYNIFYGGLFSSWGQANCCSTYPDKSEAISSSRVVRCTDVCSYNKCAIDVFSDTTQTNFWGEYKDGIYNNSNAQGITAFVEIYCCPSTCVAPDTHETTAYKCVNGNWVNEGTFGKTEICTYAGSANGNLCWCSSTSNNFYIDKNGGVHCQPSTYSSVTDKTWCGTQCTSSQTKCEGTIYYNCSSSGSWLWQGNVNGKCGYTSGGTETCSSRGGECKTLSGGAPEIFNTNGFTDCSVTQGCFCKSGTVRCDDNYCRTSCGTNQTTETNGTSKLQKGISASKIESMTALDLTSSLCTKTEQCEGYSECQSIDYLINQGYLSENSAQAKSSATIKIFSTSTGAAITTGACAVIAGIAGIPTAGAGALVILPLCAVSGGSFGYLFQDLISSVHSGDNTKFGYCIASSSLGDLAKYTGWAAFFPITGDKGIDGLIIIIALILILVFIFK